MSFRPEETFADRLERCLTDLAKRAGAAAMDCLAAGDLETDWKPDGTPVTTADLAADRIICEGLAAEFPEIPVISEEAPDEHTVPNGSFFAVDPIDGTSGFRRGGSEFTVNIALVENGAPHAGVVYAPALDRMFVTPGRGRLTETHGSRSTKHDSLRAPAGGIRVVASRSRSSRPLVQEFISGLDIASCANMSSSLKFCLLAAGEADLYPRFGRTMEWDTAAGHAVLQSVGGRVLQQDGLEPLTYGKPGFVNPDFVAAVPGVRLSGRR